MNATTVVDGWIGTRTSTGYAGAVHVQRGSDGVWREYGGGPVVVRDARVYGSALGAEYDAMRVWGCNRPSFRFPRREKCISHT